MEFSHFDTSRDCIVMHGSVVYDYNAAGQQFTTRIGPLPDWVEKVAWPGPVAYYNDRPGGAETFALLSGPESGTLSSGDLYDTAYAVYSAGVALQTVAVKVTWAYQRAVKRWYAAMGPALVSEFNLQYANPCGGDEWLERTEEFLLSKLDRDLGEVCKSLGMTGRGGRSCPLFNVLVAQFRYEVFAHIHDW